MRYAFRIVNPMKMLIWILAISAWFAAVGLFPLFYGPHELLPEWQHTIDRIVHLLGTIVFLGSLAAIVYLKRVTKGMDRANVTEISWERYR